MAASKKRRRASVNAQARDRRRRLLSEGRCGCSKPLDDIKFKSCSSCREYNSEYRRKNRPKLLQHHRQYYAANREIISYRSRIRYSLHRDEILERNRVRYWQDIEARREWGRAYYQANKEKIQQSNLRWRLGNWDRLLESIRRGKARRRAACGSVSGSEWLAIVKKQKGRCADCGKKRKLEMDHVWPVSKGGCAFAFNMAGRCAECNRRKSNKILPGVNPSLFDNIAA